MTAPTPSLGARSTCKQCNGPIEFVGRFWQHIGKTPRHPAKPQDRDVPIASVLKITFKPVAWYSNRATSGKCQACDRDCHIVVDCPETEIKRLHLCDPCTRELATILTAAVEGRLVPT